MEERKLTRTALMLGLTIVFQSLRLFIPIPAFFSTFLIGSLVNASLYITCELVGVWSAIVIVIITPIIAYLQGLLLLPIFIIPVAVGNAALVLVYFWLRNNKKRAIILAAVIKAGFLYLQFTWLLTFIAVNPKIAAGLMLAMSWPQIITGIIGGMLAIIIVDKLKIYHK